MIPTKTNLKNSQKEKIKRLKSYDRGVEKAGKFLKNNNLLAVPFEKWVGFWIVKKKQNNMKPNCCKLYIETNLKQAKTLIILRCYKNDILLHPVLSLTGSSYKNLSKTLAKFLDQNEGTKVETNTREAREII